MKIQEIGNEGWASGWINVWASSYNVCTCGPLIQKFHDANGYVYMMYVLSISGVVTRCHTLMQYYQKKIHPTVILNQGIIN